MHVGYERVSSDNHDLAVQREAQAMANSIRKWAGMSAARLTPSPVSHRLSGNIRIAMFIRDGIPRL
jgi:hypothetical protein